MLSSSFTLLSWFTYEVLLEEADGIGQLLLLHHARVLLLLQVNQVQNLLSLLNLEGLLVHS